MSRTFEYNEAKRERVPVIVGLVGPSGGGKTYSALRLATGMQRVTGGEIAVIDTESRRALHYSDQFAFRHVPFEAPFSPIDYLVAIEFARSKGASIVVVDSLSHEHEGPGGVLEWHDAEVERLREAWKVTADKANIPAWGAPKAARRKLINRILQLGVNLILCFRAKEKVALRAGKVIDMGWSPIAGEEFSYEATVQCLLLPASNGVPTWDAERPGERAMTKLPAQFESLFRERQPLSEEIGEQLARWAEGLKPGAPTGSKKKDAPAERPETDLAKVFREIDAAQSDDEIRFVAAAYKSAGWTDDEREKIRAAFAARKAALRYESCPSCGQHAPPDSVDGHAPFCDAFAE